MVNYAPLLNAPDIGQQFAQGQQQGRELRMQGQRDSALRALSTNPQDMGALNALMAVDPRTALAYRQDARAQAQEAQAAQRSQAFAGALAQAPGVPQQARDYVAQTGDVEGTQQLMALYAQADAAQKAALKERTGFLADSSRALMGLGSIEERVATGKQLARQAGLDPSLVTPESVTDTALQAAVGQSLGILKQMEFEDKALGRQLTMRGQDIQIRGQDISAANAAASRNLQAAGIGLQQQRLAWDMAKDMEARGKTQQQQANSNRQTFFNAANVLDTTQRALKLTSPSTTGRIGQLGVWTGSTPARDLRAALETIQANLGFDELKKLRDAGGTLGQVTEKEMAFLQSTLANLDQMQSESALRGALNRVQNSYLNIMSAQYGFDPYSKQGQVWKSTFLREFNRRQSGAPKAAAPAAQQGLDAAMSRHGGQ